MTRKFAALLFTATLLVGTPAAIAQESIQLGMLECDISAGIGLIFTEKQRMTCVYTPSNGGPTDSYAGTIEEFGLAIGETKGGVLTWAVVSAQKGVPKGALAGTYVGLTANASVGAGGGANDLSGGFNRAYILQPYSFQTQTGVNVAAGIAKVKLHDVQ
ncbi:DUF992 domain-containing protein [Aestuariivirga sp.]|uniref:DUF992 domain-containing protein n=1 Tax=Aestuariivirga sp. TaxID=2650926 RepID=UPI00359437BC